MAYQPYADDWSSIRAVCWEDEYQRLSQLLEQGSSAFSQATLKTGMADVLQVFSRRSSMVYPVELGLGSYF
jgi:hypothetical protein